MEQDFRPAHHGTLCFAQPTKEIVGTHATVGTEQQPKQLLKSTLADASDEGILDRCKVISDGDATTKWSTGCVARRLTGKLGIGISFASHSVTRQGSQWTVLRLLIELPFIKWSVRVVGAGRSVPGQRNKIRRWLSPENAHCIDVWTAEVGDGRVFHKFFDVHERRGARNA
jgi:hypothetical protein